ncbi:MAG TPA: BamA/TamA family outer membrane protein [Gammaproteobacteria bacterium]|nr:BamA/TamA family outer membrane protein [Gammaproteobacteria bacterium]
MEALALLLFIAAVSPAAGETAPGRIYVRRIEFEGVVNINDEVLRREMLQLEGTYLNTSALDASLRRLERLPYVQSARARLEPVPGEPDVVDVVVTITQTPARRYGGGGGYSPSELGSLHAYFVNENLFGTGRRFAFTLEGGELRDVGELSFSDPYARPSGVARTLRFSSRRISAPAANASSLDAKIDSAGVEYGYAIGQPVERPLLPKQPQSPFQTDLGETNQRVRYGLAAHRVSLTAPLASSPQLLDWIARNGTANGAAGASSTRFTEIGLTFDWRFDTRDRVRFTSSGLEQDLSVQGAAPGGDVEYFIADYEASKHWPLNDRWTAGLHAHAGFGAAYGGRTSSLPPYLNFFAGGVDSVRGYKANTLGPLDGLGHPYGGNLLLTTQFELLTEWPRKWRDRVRVGFFFDAGNVFSTEDVEFLDSQGRALDYGFDWSEIRRSAGVTARVQLPVGELELSYGIALGAHDDDSDFFPKDQLERFQLGIHVDF